MLHWRVAAGCTKRRVPRAVPQVHGHPSCRPSCCCRRCRAARVVCRRRCAVPLRALPVRDHCEPSHSRHVAFLAHRLPVSAAVKWRCLGRQRCAPPTCLHGSGLWTTAGAPPTRAAGGGVWTSLALAQWMLPSATLALLYEGQLRPCLANLPLAALHVPLTRGAAAGLVAWLVGAGRRATMRQGRKLGELCPACCCSRHCSCACGCWTARTWVFGCQCLCVCCRWARTRVITVR